MVRDNTVNGGICKACSVGQVLETVFGCVLWVADKARESVGGTNGIFAGDDGSWIGGCAFVDTFGNDGGDELEDVRANGAGYLERSMGKLKSREFWGHREVEHTTSASEISLITSSSWVLELMAR